MGRGCHMAFWRWLDAFAWLSVSAKRGATTLIARRIVKAGWDYSATLVSFPSVCYFCGIEEECFVDALWKMKRLKVKV